MRLTSPRALPPLQVVVALQGGCAVTRVRVADYGRLASDDRRLVAVASVAGRSCRLHWAAAHALELLDAEWQAAGGSPLLVASGWRPHRWRDRAHYESELRRRYGGVAQGKRWLAYDSPHETGLALDFGCCGLEPRSATHDWQRTTPLFRWLEVAGPALGWSNYAGEAWHWECAVPFERWAAPDGG